MEDGEDLQGVAGVFEGVAKIKSEGLHINRERDTPLMGPDSGQILLERKEREWQVEKYGDMKPILHSP